MVMRGCTLLATNKPDLRYVTKFTVAAKKQETYFVPNTSIAAGNTLFFSVV